MIYLEIFSPFFIFLFTRFLLKRNIFLYFFGYFHFILNLIINDSYIYIRLIIKISKNILFFICLILTPFLGLPLFISSHTLFLVDLYVYYFIWIIPSIIVISVPIYLYILFVKKPFASQINIKAMYIELKVCSFFVFFYNLIENFYIEPKEFCYISLVIILFVLIYFNLKKKKNLYSGDNCTQISLNALRNFYKKNYFDIIINGDRFDDEKIKR